MKNGSKKLSFKMAYLIFIGVLVLISVFVIIYVANVLNNYESHQPIVLVEDTLEDLRAKAKDGSLWNEYKLPEGEVAGTSITAAQSQKMFTDLLLDDDVTCELKQGVVEETTKTYCIRNGGNTLFEVVLATDGEPKTELVVFTMTDWSVNEIKLAVQPQNYTIEVPSDFTFKIDGTLVLGGAVSESNGIRTYMFENVLFCPDIEMADPNGNKAELSVRNNVIKPVVFDYSLTLPSSLKVTLNGKPHEGTLLDNGMILHAIRLLEEPQLTITDLYGNTVDYAGGGSLPLTYLRLSAPSDYSVKVHGAEVPESCRSSSSYEEYQDFAEYCTDLPDKVDYEIAVLKSDADIAVTDDSGNAVALDLTQKNIDLATPAALDSVPEEILAEIDPLEVAKLWSLFMTLDLDGTSNGFGTISKYLIPDSYMYEIADKWAHGIDIQFTSIHWLGNPPFTDESATNYVRICDNCFSVDIHFVKHMGLSTGNVEDVMNSRFYFVKHEGAWKLVHTKEIVE